LYTSWTRGVVVTVTDTRAFSAYELTLPATQALGQPPTAVAVGLLVGAPVGFAEVGAAVRDPAAPVHAVLSFVHAYSEYVDPGANPALEHQYSEKQT
jgi:hypothetical protein